MGLATGNARTRGTNLLCERRQRAYMSGWTTSGLLNQHSSVSSVLHTVPCIDTDQTSHRPGPRSAAGRCRTTSRRVTSVRSWDFSVTWGIFLAFIITFHHQCNTSDLHSAPPASQLSLQSLHLAADRTAQTQSSLGRVRADLSSARGAALIVRIPPASPIIRNHQTREPSAPICRRRLLSRLADRCLALLVSCAGLLYSCLCSRYQLLFTTHCIPPPRPATLPPPPHSRQ